MAVDSWSTFALVSVFFLGLFAPFLLKKLVALFRLSYTAMGRSSVEYERLKIHTQIYSLDHGALNVQLPPRSMWMNCGYWHDTKDDLPKAATALLEEVMKEAGLLTDSKTVEKTTRPRNNESVHVFDVGFGAGQSSIYFATDLYRGSGNPRTLSEGSEFNSSRAQAVSSLCRVCSYLGITQNKVQFAYATECLARIGVTNVSSKSIASNFGIFCQDAADPEQYGPSLKTAIRNFMSRAEHERCSKWVLGLDCLYHFAPSRKPIFTYANRQLQASIMAFDLMLDDNQHSSLRMALLRLFCFATHTPFTNLITKTEYLAQLQDAGYERSSISLRDISKQCFGPLSEYLRQRDAQLQKFGLKGIGMSFRVACWVFEWWARTGLVKGYIVVARHSRQ